MEAKRIDVHAGPSQDAIDQFSSAMAAFWSPVARSVDVKAQAIWLESQLEMTSRKSLVVILI